MLKSIAEIVATAKESLTCVTAAEAAAICKVQDAIVIDVREVAEREHKSAAGTVHIPRGILEMKMLTLHANDNLVIFTHCASGVRSILAAEQLSRLGYNNVSAITCKLDAVCASFN